ncbi:MAG: D-alanyl-D-alanine carboxypeptidase/D-alanyl-D-alanine-endopeptidase [Actinomycetota bacterium]
MRRPVRRALSAAVVVLLVASALPVLMLRDADATDRDADARAELVPIATGPTPELGGRLLTARRTPVALTAPVSQRRLAAALEGFAAQLPEQSCLSVSLDGVPTFDVRADVPLIPASTLKLLTATAVLDEIGPDARLTTTIVSAEPPVDGIVDGDVWVVGGGDPLLYTEAYAAAFGRQPQVRTAFEDVGERVAAAGVTTVTGSVVGDETRYDAVRYLPSWPERYIEQNNTGPLSALSIDDGFSRFDGPVVHADDPAAFGATVISGLLAEAGVEVVGGVGNGAAPADAHVLASVESLPTSEIVAQMLRESDNSTAELLLKELGLRLGGEGTWQAGTVAVTELLTSRGLPTAGLVVQDGSGLDRGNRATCELLRTLVDEAGRDSVLASGFAVAGETGTLANRFSDHPAEGRMIAKTGFLNEVNGLAGFVDGRSGTTIGFALVTNGVPLDSSLGFDLQDQLARVLVDQPIVPAVVDLDLADG